MPKLNCDRLDDSGSMSVNACLQQFLKKKLAPKRKMPGKISLMEASIMRTGWMVAVLLSLLSLAATGADSGDMSIAQNIGADKFQKVPGVPGCLTAAVEQGDPGKGASVLLVKGSAGCNVPWHFHTANEQLMVVSGLGRVEMEGQKAVELHAGGFASAAGKHVHQFTCVGRPCTFFLRSDGPFDVHYVDKNGGEISPDQALGKMNK